MNILAVNFISKDVILVSGRWLLISGFLPYMYLTYIAVATGKFGGSVVKISALESRRSWV